MKKQPQYPIKIYKKDKKIIIQKGKVVLELEDGDEIIIIQKLLKV